MDQLISGKNAQQTAFLQARETFAWLSKKGKKWKSRNVPAYIRERLWIPYYTTEDNEGKKLLFVICVPDDDHPKVHFREIPPPT